MELVIEENLHTFHIILKGIIYQRRKSKVSWEIAKTKKETRVYATKTKKRKGIKTGV